MDMDNKIDMRPLEDEKIIGVGVNFTDAENKHHFSDYCIEEDEVFDFELLLKQFTDSSFSAIKLPEGLYVNKSYVKGLHLIKE